MKHDNWPYKYGPPPDHLPDRDTRSPGSTFLLLLVIIAPLIYFGPQLGSIEAWLIAVYRIIEGWVLPVRELLFG